MIQTNGAFIIDNLGKILVTHPTNHSMSLWSIPKGLYDEAEETSKEAAIRETWEETNLDLDLFYNSTIYYDLGVERYTSKKKKIQAHLFFVDLPLSEMDLNLWCKSLVVNEKNGDEFPENDITKWVDFEFCEKFLHETQQKFLNKVKDFVCRIKI